MKFEKLSQIVERVVEAIPTAYNGSGSFDERFGAEVADYGFAQVPYLMMIHPELSPTEKALLVLLMGYGPVCYCKTITLAGNLGVSARYIQDVLINLEKKGWIRKFWSRDRVGPNKRKIRVIDWNPAKEKLAEFERSENLLRYLTKVKRKTARKSA